MWADPQENVWKKNEGTWNQRELVKQSIKLHVRGHEAFHENDETVEGGEKKMTARQRSAHRELGPMPTLASRSRFGHPK